MTEAAVPTWESLLARRGAAAPEIVDSLIEDALRSHAGDLHVKPEEDQVAVLLRIDGVLQRRTTLPRELHANVVARTKVLAHLLTYRTDIPQEGRMERTHDGATVDLRVSTFPTLFGEKVVIRILDSRRRPRCIEDLGLDDVTRESLREALDGNHGMILLTGPSGSGKTTTLYACLRAVTERWGETRNVVTLEDPVESVLPSTSQTQVRPETGLTFRRCLRSLLRQDPDVLMIGEIRDAETAALAIEAALTGHLVLSTVHAGTATGVFTRLGEMGLEPHLLAGAVRMVVAQRLVRTLCDEHDGPGCPRCGGIGFRGRSPISEALTVTPQVRSAIGAGKDMSELEFPRLRDAARRLIQAGRTTDEEVRRVL